MRIAPHQWSPWSLAYFVLLPRSFLSFVSAFEAGSRWGQATVVIKDALFVFGGKEDQFNQFSYTAAPNTNDIILLSLSAPFSCNSPSWELVSGASNQSTSQGPALAWSTLSALNNTDVLLFGGQLGPNSPTNSVQAQLLDVYSRLEPNWTTLLNSSVNQPPSRIRHSSVTSTLGLVFIFGGQRLDGSNLAFPNHFYFDPTLLAFTFLPSAGGPPDIWGHTSIILGDGRILVFGGFSPSSASYSSFSTIWILDTSNSTSFSWTAVQTDVTSLPSPRVDFAAVLIGEGKIIIHGGSDYTLQTNFADGWILDTTQSPMVWTAVPALTELGGRRDHFAVSSGDQVIFGFGYSNNGPAPAPLHVYNTTSGNFSSGYSPPPATALPPQTLPPPSPTASSPTYTSQPFSSTEGVHPTSTLNPHNPGNGNGTGSGTPSDGDNSSSTTAIAVGTSIGVLSLVALVLAGAYYVHKQRAKDDRDGRFVALDNDDGSESPHLGGTIPVAGMAEVDDPHHGHRRLLNSLGISGALAMASRMRSVRSATTQRRDMLADEDTRSLREWYNSQRRDGSGNSSWSLLSILGGGRLGWSHEGSTKSRGPTPWREKTDPFSDGAAVSRDEETGFIGAAAATGPPFGSRPHSRREFSHTSHVSSMSGRSYRDPFMDPTHEEFEPMDLYQDHSMMDVGDDVGDGTQPTIRHVPALAPLQTLVPPLSQQLGHPLSPLSEHTSQSTLPHNFSSSDSSQAHSGENIFSPLTGTSVLSRTTSRTSTLPPTTPSAKSVSNPFFRSSDTPLVTPLQPMRRSDSWWSRFSRTSLLDRRSYDATARQTYDIRDPTPAPKLTAIEEGSLRSAPTPSQHTPPGSSPGSAEQDKKLQIPSPPGTQSASAAGVYAATNHGKSMSSLRTADSEAIERMAGTMDVIQRVKSRSRWGSGSTSSQGGLSIDTHGSISEVGDNHSLQGSVSEAERGVADDVNLMTFASPVEDKSATTTPRVGPSRLASPPPAKRFAPVVPPPADPADTKKTENKVSARIQEYERRMSQSQTAAPSPTNSKSREERPRKQTVDYGLVPRPSLFIANPDHRLSTRSDDS